MTSLIEKAKLYRGIIEQSMQSVDDKTALEAIDLFKSWETNTAYTAGERMRYNGVLYKCIQSHTSQADWTPDVAKSLFVAVSLDEWPEWIQPTGAHDAYSKGDKVTHKEQHWVSEYDGNVWTPGEFGWSMHS